MVDRIDKNQNLNLLDTEMTTIVDGRNLGPGVCSKIQHG